MAKRLQDPGQLVPGGFLTDSMGLGHAVFFVPDLDEAHRFVVDGLGFGRSYSLHFTPVPGVDVKSAFYHRNSRHPNDQMFSFYLETPTGFQVEVGYGDVVVGEDWANDTVYGQITAWGHQPVTR